MRKSEFPFLADYVAISLRWLGVLGVTISLALSGSLNWSFAVLLMALALWNIYNTILAVLNERMHGHRQINIAVDAIVGIFLFVLGGGLAGKLAWAGVIPLLSAGMYYEWRGGLLIGLLFTLVQGVLELLVLGLSPAAIGESLGFWAVFNVLLGVGVGVISRFLMGSLRMTYQANVLARREVELRAQRMERTRMQAFYHLIETLSATLNYQVVLDTSLDMCVNALGGEHTPATKMVSAVMLFGETDLYIGSARRLPPTDMRRKFPAQKGVLPESLRKGEPTLIQTPSSDPELRQLLALQGCATALILPLRRGLDAYGVLLFAHPDADFFDQDRIELLEMVSHQAVIAIQNARLYQDLELEKERIIETQDEARKKLARDLHDGPTQSIAAIAMRINIIRMMLERTPAVVPEELVKVEDLARRTAQEIRHMLFTLRPLVLETEGLIAALEAMGEKMHDTFQENVTIEVDPQIVDQLEMTKQTVVFYLVEEALTNARKHAKASKISVRLKPIASDSSVALLEIADNGAGFDVQAVNTAYEKRGSLGMVNLRERSELIGAQLYIDSAPGKGTKVQIFIPLNSTAADRLQRGILPKL